MIRNKTRAKSDKPKAIRFFLYFSLATYVAALPACATQPAPTTPIIYAAQPAPAANPQIKNQPTQIGAGEAFMRTFCAQHGAVYNSDECRKIFLKEWARESVNSGKALSKEGFEQLDKYMKQGSRKIGRKWGEYSRAFKQGAKEGYYKK